MSLGSLLGHLLPPVRYALATTPATASPWHVRAIDIVEELSGEYVASVDLENDDLLTEPDALLGASATLTLTREGWAGAERRWSGIVRAVDEEAGFDRLGRRHCRVRIEPAFACLKEEVRTTKYQETTVPDVLREVLRAVASPFERDLKIDLVRLQETDERQYAARDLCVQYGERTFDFARRLMAEEGISYFFDFSAKTETLVLVDDNSGFTSLPGSVKLAVGESGAPREETVRSFARVRRRAPGRVMVKGFDYTRDMELVAVRQSDQSDDGRGEAEVYDPRADVTVFDYQPDEYRKSDVETQAAMRLERARASSVEGRGEGDVIAFAPGHAFVLDVDSLGSGHLAGKYLLTTVRHRGRAPERRAAGQPPGEPDYRNEFTCIPFEVPFRAPALPKPTAIEDYGIVVSASEGDPIWTDKHGRVRVRFLYDPDDSQPPHLCSPWIPVAQGWAGGGYGLQILPRAGMLVRLRYLHGDPDRPYVAGCLTTADNALPSPPPAEKTRTTWRSRSLRSGGNDRQHYNEITFDDAANAEELFLRAGRDYRRKVLNDERTEIDGRESRVVGGDQSVVVNGQRTLTVHQDETVVVHRKRTSTVEGDEQRQVSGEDRITIERDQTVTVSGDRTTRVVGREVVELQGGREERVTGDDLLHVSRRHHVIADQEWTAVQGSTEWTLKDDNSELKAGRDIILSVAGGRLKLDAQGNATLEADQRVALVCGRSSIVLTPDKIEIASPELALSGANGAIKLDAAGATTTGLNVSSKALATNELTGAFVKAN